MNLVKGNFVSAKKWSGEHFLGVYEYTYDDGSHCVLEVSTYKCFNVRKGCIKHATEEQEKEIKALLKERKIASAEKKAESKKETSDEEFESVLAATE